MRTDTLYVSDLDGTLLDDTSHVSAGTAAILAREIERGAMFTIATARTPATVQPLLRDVPVASYKDPATGERLPLPSIVMTGAALWDCALQQFTSVTLIPEKDATAIAEAFSRCSLRPFTYCLSGNSFLNVYHSRAMSRREDSFYQERRHLTLKRFHLDQEPSEMDRVVLFFATGPEATVAAVSEELQAVTDCAVAWYRDVITPETGLIDIYAPGVSKAHAVEAMARRIGARRVVVFGDNLNDLPMMRCATEAVAVDNALEEVRCQATTVIGRNTADAVAKYIRDDK